MLRAVSSSHLVYLDLDIVLGLEQAGLFEMRHLYHKLDCTCHLHSQSHLRLRKRCTQGRAWD